MFRSPRPPAAWRLVATPLLAAPLLFAPAHVVAQSLIVGIPSADVTPRRVWAITHESQIKPAWEGTPGWNTFQFLTWGIGRGTELALSFVNFGRPATGNRTVAIGFKSVLEAERGALARWQGRLMGGVMVPKSVDARGAGVWAFSGGSVRAPGARTRVTVGPTYGTPQLFGIEKVGVMAGIEQPIGSRVALIADWYSGRHDLAALIPALQVNWAHEIVTIVGYKFPNPGAPGGRAIVFEVAAPIAR